jgi:hypothetical protein
MDYIGKETFVEVGGQKYKLARFDRNILEGFIEWAGKELPSPLEVIKAHIKDFTPRQQELMIKEAVAGARSKLSLNSPEVQNLLGTPKGVIKVTSLLFQRHHPELTEKDVERIYDQCEQEHGDDYLWKKIEVASGRFPQVSQ